MVEVSLFCRRCGGRIEAEFDEDSPPSFLTCACGYCYGLEPRPDSVQDDTPPREHADACCCRDDDSGVD